MPRTMRKYFYAKLQEYLELYIRLGDRVAEIDVKGAQECLFHFPSSAFFNKAGSRESLIEFNPDYVLLNSNIHYEADIQFF